MKNVDLVALDAEAMAVATRMHRRHYEMIVKSIFQAVKLSIKFIGIITVDVCETWYASRCLNTSSIIITAFF